LTSGWIKPASRCRAIVRIDDVYPGTAPEELQRLYEPCWEHGVPVCFSVVPSSGQGDVRDNVSLVAFLDRLWRAGVIEILLHGWRHERGELAGEAADTIRGRLEAGLSVLHEAWPDIEVRVLVPPHEHLSPAGLHAARQLNLDVCATWSATRGGTRWAHWWSRLRRWAGRPAAPSRRGLWPTDIGLLDFVGPARVDRPATERALRLGSRWRTPVVFVQHPWRLLESEDVQERWLRWLAWMTARPDVQFVRFCDVGCISSLGRD
jgi:predicted deacetylase